MDYSGLKYLLTNSIRQLECIIDEKDYGNEYLSIYSEASYWLSSLEMIRGYLSALNGKNINQKVMPIEDMLSEISSEINNAYIIMYMYMSTKQKERLAIAWKLCKEAKNLLCKK